jgi:hypothetical protein
MAASSRRKLNMVEVPWIELAHLTPAQAQAGRQMAKRHPRDGAQAQIVA